MTNIAPDILPTRPQRTMMIKNLIPSLPERGKIKIGVKGKMMKSRGGTDFQPPQKLDHFLVTTLDRGPDGNFLPDADFHARNGDAPTSLPIRLLYDDPALNFPTRYACYIGRVLWCSGDGEQATRISEAPNKPAQAAPLQVQCPCFRQAPTYQGKDKCKMNGSLSALIDGAGGIGGVWKFRTTSYNSIVGIMSSMAFLRSVTGGPLAGLPLKLSLRPKQTQNPTDGSPVTIYVVNLEFDGDVPRLQAAAHDVALGRAKMHVSIEHIEDEARRVLMIAGPANAVLPGDVADEVVEEFYPEQVVEAQPPSVAAELDAFAAIPAAEIMPAEDLRLAAERAAMSGTPAFRAFWRRLNVDDRTLLSPDMAEYQRVAREADEADEAAEASQRDADPFGLLPVEPIPHIDDTPELDLGALPQSEVPQQLAALSPQPREADGEGDGGDDWARFADEAVALIERATHADINALSLSRMPRMQKMRRESGDDYRRVQRAITARVETLGMSKNEH